MTRSDGCCQCLRKFGLLNKILYHLDQGFQSILFYADAPSLHPHSGKASDLLIAENLISNKQPPLLLFEFNNHPPSLRLSFPMTCFLGDLQLRLQRQGSWTPPGSTPSISGGSQLPPFPFQSFCHFNLLRVRHFVLHHVRDYLSRHFGGGGARACGGLSHHHLSVGFRNPTAKVGLIT